MSSLSLLCILYFIDWVVIYKRPNEIIYLGIEPSTKVVQPVRVITLAILLVSSISSNTATNDNNNDGRS